MHWYAHLWSISIWLLFILFFFLNFLGTNIICLWLSKIFFVTWGPRVSISPSILNNKYPFKLIKFFPFPFLPFLPIFLLKLIISLIISHFHWSIKHVFGRWRRTGSPVSMSGSRVSSHIKWNTRVAVPHWSTGEPQLRFTGLEPGGLLLGREKAQADGVKPAVSPAVPLEKEETFRESEPWSEPVHDWEPAAQKPVEHDNASEPCSVVGEWTVEIRMRGLDGQTLGSMLDFRLQ